MKATERTLQLFQSGNYLEIARDTPLNVEYANILATRRKLEAPKFTL